MHRTINCNLLWLLIAPSYINDFSDLYVQSFGAWLAIDLIASRVIPFLLVIYAVRSGDIPSDLFKITPPSLCNSDRILILGMGMITCVALDQYLSRVVVMFFGSSPFNFPSREASFIMKEFDRHVGLIMVAVHEEVVFRVALPYLLVTRYKAHSNSLFLSSVMFGLIHWSGGVGSIVHTTLVGYVLVTTYRLTGSLIGIVVIHFIINYSDSFDIWVRLLEGWATFVS